MRVLTLDRVEPEMVLGKTLYSSDGRVLLQRGTVLGPKYLMQLRGMGFSALYVMDPAQEETLPREVVSEKTRNETVSALRDAFKTVREAKGKAVTDDWGVRRTIYNAANSIIGEVLDSRNLCFQMVEMRSADGYLFAHSVNVCILGVALARKLNLPYAKMVDLAIGLLLHDIGKLALSDELRDPSRVLTEVEEYEYQRHTTGGFGLLKDMGQTFGATSKIIALQHHERWDGTGYPKRLKGNAIHEFAQIAAVVNTYDRLTTSNKYGKQALPHEALEYLMGSCGTHFKLSVVQAFLEIVAPFPIGSTVKLNTGDTGVVIEVEEKLPQRPVVRLIRPGETRAVPLRLVEHPDRVVTGVENY